MSRSDGSSKAKWGQVRSLPIDSLRLAPENETIYKAISFDDPDIVELACSIKAIGVLEPLLVSSDGYLISGHRRACAARLAKLDHVPVRLHPISRALNPEEFLKLLIEMNSQRIKNTSELFHESLIKINPRKAHQQIVNDRKAKDVRRGASLSSIEPDDYRNRCVISEAKTPFLEAVLAVLEAQQDYWPLSDRQIHYRLLGPDAPLTHASKPNSRYRNDKASYRKLTDLLTRARLEGHVPWESIGDETRPTDLHAAFWNRAEFFRGAFDQFLKGYWRNRQQSQPHHIEIVPEKLTVRSILQKVAQEYTVPLTITRGMSSLPPKKAILDRYIQSHKDKLILLVVSDLDPAGDAIAADLVKSFRTDFGLENEFTFENSVEAYKVALTIEQVRDFGLAPSMEAKDTSPTYAAFVERYDITDAYELEAFPPAELARTLDAALKDVLDLEAYNEELAAEEADSVQIIAVQQQAQAFFSSLNL